MRKKIPFWKEFIPKSWITCRKGYSLAFFKQDLTAGVTVGVVALPLAMAFAIASGVGPEKGLYTAIIAGFLISLFGGSRFQIGGPTGAFVLVLYMIIQRDGYTGLAAASLLAGVFLIVAAFFRLGSFIKYIPYPLIVGFTTGIAVFIFSSQIVDFFGLHMEVVPVDFIDKWRAIFSSFSTWQPYTFSVALGTLVLITLVRRFFPVIPWGISAVAISTLVCYVFHLPVETIASRFGELSSSLPWPAFPKLSLSWEHVNRLIVNAVTIAFLGGVESLLSAVMADGMTGGRHKSNCELLGQGIGNIGSIFFGGIPATGALARTATNVKSGAKTPIAGMIHSITLLVIVLFLSPVVSLIPLAALSAVLVIVALDMSEFHRFLHLFKAPKGDVAILLITFLLTIFTDLIVAVEVGMILSAFLFMKRVGDFSSIMSFSAWEEKEKEEAERQDLKVFSERRKVPPGIEVYDISGPFFVGIADSLKSVLSYVEFAPKVFILRMHKVPLIDASGMQSLKEFYEKCHKEKTRLLLSGVHSSLMHCLKKFEVVNFIGKENIFSHFDAALKKAEDFL